MRYSHLRLPHYLGALLLAGIFSFSVANIADAAGWVSRSSGTTNRLNGVDFYDDSNGMAAGVSGTVLKTTDKGKTWSNVSPSAISDHLFDIEMTGTGTAIAVGQSGTIIKTTDSGANWTDVGPSTSEIFLAVHMATATNGIAVGTNGVIFRTTDSGSNWTSVTSGTTESLYDIYGYSTGNPYWAVGANGTILKSTSGGGTWTAQASGATEHLLGVDFTSSLIGWAVGNNGTLLKTTSGGSVWTAFTSSAVTAGDSQQDVDASSSTSGLITSEDGILETSDGSTWTAVTDYTTFSSTMTDIYNSSNIKFAVGYDGGLFRYDGTAPTDPVATTHYTNDTTPTLSWTASTDEYSDLSYELKKGASSWVNVGTNPSKTWVTALSAGTHEFYVRAIDSAENTSDYDKFDVVVDTTAPTVPLVGVTSAAVGETLSFRVAATDSVGLDTCSLYVNSTLQGTMTAGTSAHTYAMTATTAGTYSAYAACTDLAGNSASSSSPTSYTVAAASTADTTTPTVGTVNPTTATAGTAVTLSATVSDDTGIDTCTLYVDGTDQGAMTMSGSTASRSHTFAGAGTYSAYAWCDDAAGNDTSGSAVTVTVSSATTVDTTAPTVGSLSPTTAIDDVSVLLSMTYSDSVGVASCTLYIDGVGAGSMTLGAGSAYDSYTFSTSGTHSAYATCQDAAGNSGVGTSVSIAVAAAGTPDATDPSVGAVTPTTATAGTALTLSASYSDNVGVADCDLYVNGVNQGGMTLSGTTASATYTFSTAGSYSTYASCSDAAGNTDTGTSATITVSAATTETPADEAAPGSLIKLACASGADVNDPCRAVYYYDVTLGKRHAFPNEKVYFTWYENFDGVIVVTNTFMASLTLGGNVTYHPGTTMVKFITVNTVYAVGEEGELRAVSSEDVAASIWGSTWNRQIHDISDAFFGNYDFGEDIDSTSDFDPDAVEDAVDAVDDIL